MEGTQVELSPRSKSLTGLMAELEIQEERDATILECSRSASANGCTSKEDELQLEIAALKAERAAWHQERAALKAEIEAMNHAHAKPVTDWKQVHKTMACFLVNKDAASGELLAQHYELRKGDPAMALLFRTCTDRAHAALVTDEYKLAQKLGVRSVAEKLARQYM